MTRGVRVASAAREGALHKLSPALCAGLGLLSAASRANDIRSSFANLGSFGGSG